MYSFFSKQMKSVKYEIKEESFSSEELFKSELNEMMALIDYKQFAPKLESVKIEQTDVELNHQKYKAEWVCFGFFVVTDNGPNSF